MRYFIYVFLILSVTTVAFGTTGASVTYRVNGQSYEGYYISPFDQAPFVLLIHDWDGLTDYEVKRANMLAELGYSVFALDLFGAGVRPTKVTDKRQHTGELYKNREKMRALMKVPWIRPGIRAPGSIMPSWQAIVSAAQPCWNWRDPGLTLKVLPLFMGASRHRKAKITPTPGGKF